MGYQWDKKTLLSVGAGYASSPVDKDKRTLYLPLDRAVIFGVGVTRELEGGDIIEVNLDYIDIGSGFKVAYREGDICTDIESFGKSLSKRFNKFSSEYGKDLTLIFEPGKFLVSEAGYLMARVNVIKQTTATVFAGLDTGMNHLIRPMFYDAYHQIINVSNPKGKKTRIYTVVGYICETDTFGWNRKITEISEGDILAFKNAGAYCYAMASNYNSRFKPAEVMVHKQQDYLIRKREEMEDLTRNQVILNDVL